MQTNNAINPKKEDYAAKIMPCRSSKITKVTPLPPNNDIGGATDTKTGRVTVPMGEGAFNRVMRYHEALHASFTSPASKPLDLLDQALEDARLHRYCSTSRESAYSQARRDEKAVALRDLRMAIQSKAPATAVNSLAVLRAFGILDGVDLTLSDTTTLVKAMLKLGPDTPIHFRKALDILGKCKESRDSALWEEARNAVQRYFSKEFKGEKGEPKFKEIKKISLKLQTSGQSLSSSKSDTLDKKEEVEEVKESASSSKSTKKEKPENKEEKGSIPSKSWDDLIEQTPEYQTIKSDIKLEIAPPQEEEIPTDPSPDLYTGDLAPECDKEEFEKNDAVHPIKLYIRRLDMSINRVKINMGRNAPMPSQSGRKILSRKLASSLTPGVKIFQRSTNEGGYGTILIDASGSMSIPPSTLIDFLAKAPALTLAFYNAYSDCYYNEHALQRAALNGCDVNEPNAGNIFIYAANGYRDNPASISGSSIPHYHGGNLVDYHALAWLIKQPSPRYFVSDKGFTGPWVDAARGLFRKLAQTKQIIHVETLGDMEVALEEARRKHRWG